MDKIKVAREALQKNILAAVRGFETNFPGAYVGVIHVLHETPMTASPVTEIRVEVRL